MAADLMQNYGTPETPFYEADLQLFNMNLGEFPKDETAARRIMEGIGALYKERLGHSLFNGIGRFLAISMQERIIRDYHAGTLSPGLASLLERNLPGQNLLTTVATDTLSFKTPRELVKDMLQPVKAWRELVGDMIQAGKADFSLFKGPQDVGENWLFRYSINPYILSVYIDNDIIFTEGQIKNRKAEAIQHLKGILAAALDDTTEQPGEGPLKESTLYSYTDTLSYLYSIRTGTEAELHSGFFMETPGFYMNPITGEVIDLRPYTEEIRHLTAPISWGFITEYTRAILDYLAERQRKNNSLLGPGNFVAIKNTPESTAISTLTTGYSEIFAQGSLFPDETRDYTADIFTSQTDKSRQLQIRINAPIGSRGPRPSTMKLKILLEMLFTECGKPFFTFGIDDYLKATLQPGRTISAAMRKKFKQKLFSDLKLLRGLRFSANYPGQEAGEIGLLNDWVPGPGNTMEIGLDLVYCKRLKQGGLAYYPRGIFQIDEKYPHALHFLEKLAQNRTAAKNVRKGGLRKNTISLKSLIETDYSFLPLEKVQKTRKYKEAYIDPTVNTIVYLNEAGYITSRYVNADHEEYTADDLARVKYEDFIDRRQWLLEYDLIDYQDNPKLNEPKPEHPKPKKKAHKKKTE